MIGGIPLEFTGLLLLTAGYVVGLGAVTVIDVHGFLARKSGYWTQATIRAHKVTKPLIWLGTFLAILGGLIFYGVEPIKPFMYLHGIAAIVLIGNGLFLSFAVSPYLLNQETEGQDTKLLPQSLQRKIAASFTVSVFGWWGSLAGFVYVLTTRYIL